ncbi:hypothetical protein DLV27_10340 [Shigella flexneri]|nr:hypothetical protein [Shigella flexneri]EFV7179842.1 hypothetical protein [Shigella flexneri]EFW7326635.1 hypothetical protein [Shigella flexneri]EFX0107223.1 hypothetical protein [Shigella flexneri]EFX5210828.1 hypothetical protein [Shigella flexneri]
MSISRSQCAGQKNIAKSGAGTQNRIEVAGKKNAALFEWAAFVKAEKSELVLRVTQYSESARASAQSTLSAQWRSLSLRH